MPRSPRTMKRRRFVTLLALAGGALVAAPLSRASEKAKPEERRARTAAVRKEIETQEKSLAEQLKTIRAYELPPGSAMAFSFRPMKAKRGSRR